MSRTNPNREQALELKAGVFVLIGLIFIAMMAFKFGRLGQGLFQHYYSITVTFPSANGLIKNSDVQLAGARIGYVADKPAITPGGSGVTLPLKILADVKIPRETTFEVGSSGLLGDKFVDIKAKKEFNPATFNPGDPKQVIEPGASVAGSPVGGLLGALQDKAESTFDELKLEISKLTVVTDKINNGILSPENQRDISETLEHLKGTSEHFDTASKDLDSVVINAKGAVDSAKETINAARQTLVSIDSDAVDVHGAIDAAKAALNSARDLLARAQSGNGPIATLLNDAQLSQNLKALVTNLREHGVLFYKNKPLPGQGAQGPPAGVNRQF